MFELLFNYPPAVYRKGTLVFASGWPAWWLLFLILAAAGTVGALLWKKPLARRRALVLGLLEWGVLALLLVLLWQPALSVAALKPQQNVVAVVVDVSSSMALEDRIGQARRLLDATLLPALRRRFPVRLYAAGDGLRRVERTPTAASQPRTDLGEALRAAAAEAALLPVGAVVLLSDGADNGGGLGSETMELLRASRIPIHAVGFGSQTMRDDVELTGADLPQKVLPGGRLLLTVNLRQAGFSGRTARLIVKDGGATLAQRDIKLRDGGEPWRETVPMSAPEAGLRSLDISITPLEGERNLKNNSATRLLEVEDRRPRILYFEGEPRWEMKFIRRAAELDQQLELASILRTTENKFYRQGIASPSELEHGFPASVEELFHYQGLIIGNVEASYFTPVQQSMIKEFIDRRGGGVLFLGGRAALADGGWNGSALAEALPVELPARKGTFHRDPATVELTRAGAESVIPLLEEDPARNAARWKAMPYLASYQETGAAKPGAAVLLEAVVSARGRFPLLVTQNYGRGRVALLATGGTWRWQMAQDARDMSHEMFWRQLLRWLAGGVEERVTLSVDPQVCEGDSTLTFRAEVRDRNYLPGAGAVVEAHILGPGSLASSVVLQPAKEEAGVYTAQWKAPREGDYAAEAAARDGAQELGRAAAAFRREDGRAESFHTEQDRELLERLARQTGGRYYTPGEAPGLAREVELSEAGISVRETRAVWNAPAAFLLLAGLKAGEWLLRRKWGAV